MHNLWFPNNSFLLSENTPQHPHQWEAVSPKRTTGLATNSFFLVCYLEKLIALPEGKINNPSLGRMLSFVPPRNSLERHIELIMHNSRPHNSCIASITPEIQGQFQFLCHAQCKGLRTLLTTTDANLNDCMFVKQVKPTTSRVCTLI